MDVQWNQDAQKTFDAVIGNLPQFHRSIAEQLVKQKAENLAAARTAKSVENTDVVIAFFQEVPPAFKDMMKRLMSQQGIEYEKYINE